MPTAARLAAGPTTDLPPPESGRIIPALDGLRALAILLVIPHNIDLLGASLPSFAYPATLLVHAGWIGVQLFFVLSGFLITGNLLDSQGSANYYTVFFGRRALRILPLYYTVLLLTFVVVPLLSELPAPLASSQHQQLWLWTFLVNWTQPFNGGVYGFAHFWSLAVEEQFYLLWPFFVRRTAPTALLRLCAGLTLTAIASRSILLKLNFPHESAYMFTVCRMDALALGAAAAAVVRIPAILDAARRQASPIAALALLVLLGAAVSTHMFNIDGTASQTFGYTVIALGFALLVMLAAASTAGPAGKVFGWLGAAPLRLIGRYSYAMYVFHMPLHVFFGVRIIHALNIHIGGRIALSYTLAIMAASFFAAALSYHLFERRLLRLKRYFVPRPRPAAVA